MAFSLAIGAQRVIAIRSRRIKLAEHESPPGSHAAGHAIERHVGKTAEELFERPEKSPRLTSSSSFKNTLDAEVLISKVLRDKKI
ncbi:RNase A-like domain-containing protein [Pantoea ananatis]|uniref:RNase A-like domain-containing protein n=1 Tax=Pantoea ananas TaxID=553 RepID=UPI003CF88038